MNLFKTRIFSIFGMALLATGFVACSSDDNATTETNTQMENSIKSTNSEMSDISGLAKAIYHDSDIKSYNEKLLEFGDKILVLKNYAEIENLQSNDELFNWAQNNIEKTNFKSIDEIQNLKSQTVELKSRYSSKFKSDVKRVIKSDLDLKLFADELNLLAIEEIRTISGGSNCYEKAKRCIESAQITAGVAFTLSAVSSLGNPLLGGLGMYGTYVIYKNQLKNCQADFDDCMKK